jgi:hypothetical protein
VSYSKLNHKNIPLNNDQIWKVRWVH